MSTYLTYEIHIIFSPTFQYCAYSRHLWGDVLLLLLLLLLV